MIVRRLTITVITLCIWLSAQAEQPQPGQERQILPYQCEKWQSRIQALSESNDPLEKQLGELLTEPEVQFCQVQRVRVSPPEKDGEFWFNLDLDLEGIAGFLRLLAITALILLALWLAWRWRPESFRSTATDDSGRALPSSQRSRLAPDQTPLPVNIAAAADKAWNNGQHRHAMSLLYQGAIARLLPSQHQARTEREVLAAIRLASHPAQLVRFVSRLTRLWQQTAWANQPPPSDDFSTLRHEWQNHFERSKNPAS